MLRQCSDSVSYAQIAILQNVCNQLARMSWVIHPHNLSLVVVLIIDKHSASPSNPNVNRQFPLTFTAHNPDNSPFNGCQSQPATFIFSGDRASPNAVSCVLAVPHASAESLPSIPSQ